MHSSNTPVVSATVVVSSIAHKVLSSEGQAGKSGLRKSLARMRYGNVSN